MKTNLPFTPSSKKRHTVKEKIAPLSNKAIGQITLKKGLPSHFAEKILKLEALCNEKRASPSQV